VAKKLIDTQTGEEALRNLETQTPTAVRFLLQRIEKDHPGHSVELRIPPYGAIQCIAGLNHRRGTPPNVVEMPPEVFIRICLGELSLEAAEAAGSVLVSGVLAKELTDIFPLEI